MSNGFVSHRSALKATDRTEIAYITPTDTTVPEFPIAHGDIGKNKATICLSRPFEDVATRDSLRG
jgi:hypothetical protein